MKVSGVFTVPEYYLEFQCKGGQCRHTCCCGLEIDITEEEYYRLITLPCSPALRDRIDLGLRLNTAADVNRYAKIQHNFLGDCKFLDEEGLCALQLECGEETLNRVCRYYPRSPRIEEGKRCATSNSCEETLEVLLRMAKEGRPFRLTRTELSFDLAGERPEGEENKEKEELRIELLKVLAEDSLPLSDRLTEMIRMTGEERSTAPGPDINARFPWFSRFLTLALANDFFYRNLPFGDEGNRLSPGEEMEVFAEMTKRLVKKAGDAGNEEEMIDLFAEFFRRVDLTDYDRNLYALMKK